MPKRTDSVATTLGASRKVFNLVEAIAAKRTKQLGFRVSKAAVIENLVIAEARSLGLYPKKEK